MSDITSIELLFGGEGTTPRPARVQRPFPTCQYVTFRSCAEGRHDECAGEQLSSGLAYECKCACHGELVEPPRECPICRKTAA